MAIFSSDVAKLPTPPSIPALNLNDQDLLLKSPQHQRLRYDIKVVMKYELLREETPNAKRRHCYQKRRDGAIRHVGVDGSVGERWRVIALSGLALCLTSF